MAEKYVVKRLIDGLDMVLNGYTLCFAMEHSTEAIPTEDEIKEMVAPEEFDLQIIKADFQQQEGDLFHDLVGARNWKPRTRHFSRSEPTLVVLEEKKRRAYFCGRG